MPPKKAVDVSKAGTGDEAAASKEQPMREGINIEDLNLPKSIVTRLAKGVLPPNTQIQGNAMLAMTKSATVFVNYLASHANEYAVQQNRRTLQTGDVFAALDELEFSEWKPRLEAELARFNEIQMDKRNTYRKKIADKAGHTDDTQVNEGDDMNHDSQGDVEGQRDGPPAAKKARLEVGAVVSGAEGDREPEKPTSADQTDDEDGEEDEGEEDEDEDEDETEGQEERQETEELEESMQDREADDDEALDNGDDSD